MQAYVAQAKAFCKLMSVRDFAPRTSRRACEGHKFQDIIDCVAFPLNATCLNCNATAIMAENATVGVAGMMLAPLFWFIWLRVGSGKREISSSDEWRSSNWDTICISYCGTCNNAGIECVLGLVCESRHLERNYHHWDYRLSLAPERSSAGCCCCNLKERGDASCLTWPCRKGHSCIFFQV